MKLPRLVSLCIGTAAMSFGSGCATAKPAMSQTFTSTPLAVSELRKGSLDAVVGDYPVLAYMAREGFGERLEVVDQQFDPSSVGIAIKKGNGSLQATITAALRRCMLDESYKNALLNWGLRIAQIDPPAEPGIVPKSSEVPELADGKLLVGMELAFAPMEFFDELKQEAGVDVELARALGKQLGVEVELVNIPFDRLLPALSEGKVDVVISAMTITPERTTSADFVPYMTTGTGVLVKPGNPANIRDLKGLCGKNVGLQQGTAQVELVTAIPCGS